MSRRERRGANAVEFALTVPFMILLLGGVFDYGFYFTNRGHVYQAALAGVRAGAVIDGEAAAIIAADNACEATMTAFGLPANGCTGSAVFVNGERTIQMDVSVTHTGIIVASVMPSDITFVMAMRMENQ